MAFTYTTASPDEVQELSNILDRLAAALNIPRDELLRGEIKVSRMSGGHYHAAVTVTE